MDDHAPRGRRLSGPAEASDLFPAREIELVVSFPAGGPADTSARIVAPKLSAILGVPVVVANEPGGGGAIGADYVAKARPDGHTVYAATNSPLTINPHLQKVPYKMADFAPLGAYAVDLGVITTRGGGPAKTLQEFVDYARKNPGKLSYGSAGFGTVSFFTMELFQGRPITGPEARKLPTRGFGIARLRQRLRSVGIDPDSIGSPGGPRRMPRPDNHDEPPPEEKG